MKNAIVIALALVSVSAFATAHSKPTKAETKAAREACAEQKADKKAFKACVGEKLASAAAATHAAADATHAAAPAVEVKTETAPAPAHK